MAGLTRLFMIAGIVSLGIAASGCSRTVIVKKGDGPNIHPEEQHEHEKHKHEKHEHGGPPPHAPAHGYRHKHSDGSVLLFDSQFGVYVVTGHVEVYFHDVSYYRIYKGMIETSNKANGPWHKANSKNIPDGIHKKVAAANEVDEEEETDTKGNGKGKGNDKDKDDDKDKGNDKDKDDDKDKGNDKDKGDGKGKKG